MERAEVVTSQQEDVLECPGAAGGGRLVSGPGPGTT